MDSGKPDVLVGQPLDLILCSRQLGDCDVNRGLCHRSMRCDSRSMIETSFNKDVNSNEAAAAVFGTYAHHS